jgi:NAD(P)-dependent dehydrogenase (short-subunit alcohol dehydrogenase family)
MVLKNEVAIVTGAGSGIGKAIAHKFAREGANLVLGGLLDDPVREVAEAITVRGGEAEAYTGDLADETNAWALVDFAARRHGKIDILVSNAGIFIANAETDAYRIEDFDRTLRSNVRAAFLMTKFALPHLQKTRGNIIFTGSEAGLNGSPMFTPYGGFATRMMVCMAKKSTECCDKERECRIPSRFERGLGHYNIRDFGRPGGAKG